MNIHPWQHPQWQQVSSYFQEGRFPHALLLAGPKDVGKLHFARLLTHCLLCKTGQHASFACGTCRDCQLMHDNNHPDFFSVQPETEGGIVKIEQIRILIETLSQTGLRGGRQLVIIEPAEAMNRAAANALLKTLEEPSGDVVFLLISHQPSLLPPTITSRCQKVVFHPPPITVGLSSQRQVDDQKLEEALLQLYMQKIYPTTMAEICAAIDFAVVFNALWLTIMKLLQVKLIGGSPQIMPNQMALFLQASDNVTCFTLFQLIEKLLQLKKQMVVDQINFNLLLMFEDLFGGLLTL